MWSELSARRAARVAIALALTMALTAPADAKARSRKAERPAAEFGLSGQLSRALPVSTPTPLRFFSINEVLAKRDRAARGDDSVRLAALQGTISDAPAREAPPRGEEPFGLPALLSERMEPLGVPGRSFGAARDDLAQDEARGQDRRSARPARPDFVVGVGPRHQVQLECVE